MIRKYLTLIFIIILASFLRLYKLDTVPVSMFGDEMDVGYQAYSILKTGKDYYGNFMPLHIQSIAEWRTPVYIYSVVPTVAIFGITPLGVRLPAAIFGILGVIGFYFLIRKIRLTYLGINSSSLETVASFLLAISPWHIQYSRAGFEATQMLFFLIAGIFFFFESLKKNSNFLLVSAAFFGLMPWVYSTAKLFTPMLVIFLILIFSRNLSKLNKRNLAGSILVFALFIVPLVFTILFGGGAQRFSYISVFSDPTIKHEVGVARDIDGWGNNVFSRAFHNKFTFWGEAVIDNFLNSFSNNFLFVGGDINLRHSIKGMGMFYKVEFIALILGISFFFLKNVDTKIRIFFAFWIIAGAIPSAITREGGGHATRLIIILPPLLFLISYGINFLTNKRFLLYFYFFVLGMLFINYQHLFWIHNPTYSERWWHYGWKESVSFIKQVEDKYSKVVITTADEPPLVFFLASYEYPPSRWHEEFLNQKEIVLKNKFYFQRLDGDVYSWGKVLEKNTLYLASEKEVKVNLIREPERTPGDLMLLKSIPFPSGEPAFYIFSGKEKK